MKKLLIFAFLIILLPIVLADLSDYPGNLMTSGKFQGYIVTGSELGAVGIVSATNIQMSIAEYIPQGRLGIVKLDTEMNLSHNLILIGNPCVNKLSAELLNNPEPCDKDFPSGKTYILYYEKSGNKYVIAAGKSSKSTREAADYLANYKRHPLNGQEVVIITEEEQESEPESNGGMPAADIVAPATGGNEAGQEEILENSQSVQDNKSGMLKQDEGKAEPTIAPKIVVEEKGFFARMLDWITSLFRR